MGVALCPILFLCARLVTLSLRRRPAAAGGTFAIGPGDMHPLGSAWCSPVPAAGRCGCCSTGTSLDATGRRPLHQGSRPWNHRDEVIDVGWAAPPRGLPGAGGNGPLRRVVEGYALFTLAEYSVWLAVLVYAYSRGGATVRLSRVP
jgi:hypothetical protein